MQKDYLALVRGDWPSHLKVVQAPLLKTFCKAASAWCGSAPRASRQKHVLKLKNVLAGDIG